MKNLLNLAKNIFFPKYCFGCKCLGVYLCNACSKKLQLADFDICPYCRKKSWFGLTHPGCKQRYGLDGLKSLLRYNGFLQSIIKQIKYHHVSEAMCDLLMAISQKKLEELFFYQKLAGNFIVIPVPLHPKRLQLRGFNQSETVAQFIGEQVGFKVVNNLVGRIKNTASQAMLPTPNARYQNVRGAFKLLGKLEGEKAIIVVDDIWTTGSTVRQVCKILKQHSTAPVMALTLAR